MFETSKEMQLCGYPNVSTASRLQWHSVTQTLLIRWFHIRYLCEDYMTEQVLLTGDLEVLESLNADKSFHLIAVHLVSPPNLNGTDNWAFSPLSRVTTVVRNRLGRQELLGYEYQVSDGKVLVEQFSSCVALDNANFERLDLCIRIVDPTLQSTPH